MFQTNYTCTFSKSMIFRTLETENNTCAGLNTNIWNITYSLYYNKFVSVFSLSHV